MKRYKMHGLIEIEDPNGEWVRWEDSKDDFFRFSEIYEKRIRELKSMIKQECNCAEMVKGEMVDVEYPRLTTVDSWIWAQETITKGGFKMIDTNELRKAAQAVFLATDEEVAQDISDKLNRAADAIFALQDLVIWMTGCGYDFCQHGYFRYKRDELLKGLTMNEQQLIESGYFNEPSGNICLKCGCIKIEALPHEGSWSTPVCRCGDSEDKT